MIQWDLFEGQSRRPLVVDGKVAQVLDLALPRPLKQSVERDNQGCSSSHCSAKSRFMGLAR